jgi:hypothetical protein
MEIPGFVTHYHLADRRPFLNLSDLEREELERVRSGLHALREHGHKRPFGRRYIEFRRLTEGRLRELFAAAGGVRERNAPHYFVLGRCESFKKLAPGTEEVVLSLDELPAAVTSFTYCDSFEAMGFGERFGLPRGEVQPYHDRVYRMEELESVIGEFGMPGVEFDTLWQEQVERFVEVQLWSDGPVSRFL